MLHILLHFIIPLSIASVWFKPHWQKAYGLMIFAFIVDLDHLLATPIYEANRCSINFHPLHLLYLQPIYLLLCLPKVTRYFGIGLCIHMLLDSLDCQINQGIWYTAF